MLALIFGSLGAVLCYWAFRKRAKPSHERSWYDRFFVRLAVAGFGFGLFVANNAIANHKFPIAAALAIPIILAFFGFILGGAGDLLAWFDWLAVRRNEKKRNQATLESDSQ